MLVTLASSWKGVVLLVGRSCLLSLLFLRSRLLFVGRLVRTRISSSSLLSSPCSLVVRVVSVFFTVVNSQCQYIIRAGPAAPLLVWSWRWWLVGPAHVHMQQKIETFKFSTTR
jgi:hypothetical protein